MCSTNRRDLPHSTLFPLKWGWIADNGIDYEIRWVKVNPGIGSHTPCFSLNTVSVYKYTVCNGGNGGRGVWGSGPQSDTPPAAKSVYRSIFLDDDILHCILWVLSFHDFLAKEYYYICKILKGNYGGKEVAQVRKTLNYGYIINTTNLCYFPP
jgi:hypothetical protein